MTQIANLGRRKKKQILDALPSFDHLENPNELPPHKLRKVLDFLYDGNLDTHRYLYFINSHFKRAHKMFLWLCRNDLKGKKLVEFFQNQSPDGGGYICGCATIISRMDGKKYSIEYVNAQELKD